MDADMMPHRATAPSARLAAHPSMSRTTLPALIGVLCVGVLPTLLIRLLRIDGEFRYIATWWKGTAGGDSWTPIQRAIAYVAAHGATGLYEATYYHSADQFLYSPLSLILYRITNLPPLLDWSSAASLNHFSWWVTVASAALLALLLVDSTRRFVLDGKWPTAIETGALVVLAFGASLVFYPSLRAYNLGQIQTSINFCLLLAIFLWIGNQRFAVGAVLGVVCIVKPQLAPMLLWGLVRRETSLVAGMVVVGLAFGIASLWSYGWPVHHEYLSLMSYLSWRGESVYSNHSVNGLLNRMFFLGNNLEWDGTHTSLPYNPWIHYATVASSLALIVPLFIFRRASGPLASALDFCIGLLTLTLASPVAYEVHFGFLLPVFWITFIAIWRSHENSRVQLGLLAISYALFTHYWSPTKIFADTYFNFVQSYMLFGAVLLLIQMYRLRSRTIETAPNG